MKKISFICIALSMTSIISAAPAENSSSAKQSAKELIATGQKLEKAKQFEAAIEAYNEAIAVEKNILGLQNALLKSAKAKVKIKDLGGAINDLEKLLSLKKNNPTVGLINYQTAILEIANIYSNHVKDFNGAIALVDQALADKSYNASMIKKFIQRKNALLQGQVNELVKYKKFDQARKLAATNLKNMPSDATKIAVINTEIAYAKYLTAKKKLKESEAILRAAAKIKVANSKIYWAIQEAILQNAIVSKNIVIAQKELDILKKMSNGDKLYLVKPQERFFLAFGKNKELVDFLINTAKDSKLTKRKQADLYADASFYAVSKLKNLKLSRELYAKAKALAGKNYRNMRVEKSQAYWEKKL